MKGTIGFSVPPARPSVQVPFGLFFEYHPPLTLNILLFMFFFLPWVYTSKCPPPPRSLFPLPPPFFFRLLPCSRRLACPFEPGSCPFSKVPSPWRIFPDFFLPLISPVSSGCFSIPALARFKGGHSFSAFLLTVFTPCSIFFNEKVCLFAPSPLSYCFLALRSGFFLCQLAVSFSPLSPARVGTEAAPFFLPTGLDSPSLCPRIDCSPFQVS